MDDRRSLLRWDRGGESIVDLVHDAQPQAAVDLSVRRLELGVPPLELTGDVAVSAPEVAQPHLVDVDGVDARQDVDDRLTGTATLLVRQRGRVGRAANDATVDEVHDVERRSVDRVVAAQPDRGRHRHGGRAERGDDAVLSSHVVCSGEHLAQRRSAKHPAPVVGVGDAEGQVRVASGDQLEAERFAQGRDVGAEPVGHCGGIDAAGNAVVDWGRFGHSLRCFRSEGRSAGGVGQPRYSGRR